MDVEAMIESAFKDVMHVMPIDRCTVADLARRSGLSRQAFYSHFEDKYELSIRIFERSFTPMAERNRSGATSWLESGVEHLGIYKADPVYYKNVLSSYERCALRAYLDTRIFGEFQFKCLSRGMDPDDSDAMFAVRMYAHSTNQVTFEWIDGGCLEPEKEIVRLFDVCRPLILSPYLGEQGSYVPGRVL